MSSYIEYDAKKVVNACDKLLNRIAEKREEQIEIYIEQYMNKKIFKCYSREEAIGKIKRKNMIHGVNVSIYDWIMYNTYDCQEDAVKRLKKLAETKLNSIGHGGSCDVNLCGKDCDLISRYL